MLHSRALLDMGHRLLLIPWILLLFPVLILGQAPDSLSFQGYLTDTGGTPLNTTVPMTFKLYKSGVKVWEQTHASVAVSNGRFDVLLGGTGTASLDTVAFNEPIDLGITVGGDPEIVPRTPLAASPYALGLRGISIVFGASGLAEGVSLKAGAQHNHIEPDAVGSTISGGGGWFGTAAYPHSALGFWGTIGGGLNNSTWRFATVGGGLANSALGVNSTVCGGNANSATEQDATVAGGLDNQASGDYSAIIGGRSNRAEGDTSAVGGGASNTASGGSAFVGGGYSNEASGRFAFVGGGSGNTASGDWSAVPGGVLNRASADYSFAAGRRARAQHRGSFVWADQSIDVDFESSANHQFLIRAMGGVGIGTSYPSNVLSVEGSTDISGNLGIGTDAPAAQIHAVKSDGSAKGLKLESVEGDRASFYYVIDQGLVIDSYRPKDARRLDLFFQPNGGNVGIGTLSPGYLLEVDGDAAKPGGGSWTVASDERLKDVEAPFDRGLDALRALHPVSYRYKKDNPRGLPSDQTYVGLVAQAVAEVIPEAVDTDGAGYLHLNNDPIIWTMLNAINALREQVEDQRLEIARLKQVVN